MVKILRELRGRRDLMKAGAEWQDCDAIVVASGPGLFTGIRIGMSFAAVLARRLGIPALAISRFEALAAKTPGKSVCAVLPGCDRGSKRGAQGAIVKHCCPRAWMRRQARSA